MKHRNPIGVFFLSIVTLGIYDIYWLAVTKKELNQKTRIHTPTIWLLFAPVAVMIVALVIAFTAAASANHSNTFSSGSSGTAIISIVIEFVAVLTIVPISLFWFLRFSKAVNEYTGGKSSTGVTFLMLWLLHFIGVAIVQDTFNDMAARLPMPQNSAAGSVPAAPQPSIPQNNGFAQPVPPVAPQTTVPPQNPQPPAQTPPAPPV